MAEQDKIIGCLTPPVEWRTFLKMLGIKDADENFSINIYYNELAECEDVESAYECLYELSFEEILRLIVVEDKCGRPSINLIGAVCSACDEQEEEQIL